MANNPKGLIAGLDSTPVLLSQAENGDIEAAHELLEKAADLIAEGKPLPEELAMWVSQGLKAITQGADAKTIFNLRKPRGRPSKHSEEFERLVAESIHYSKAGRHKAINADGTSQGAYAEAAEYFGISENIAEKFYKSHIDNILIEEAIDRELRDENEED